ncbi:SPI-1 type III secretion system chaperone SpaK [Plesiomonas sp.]|uniref:InvB/SpaK family type III secretion system chaperone n=1 Tax=Plesiomonas sp. TaxID=2486279 RepID=UPI003F3581A5
MYIPDIRLLIQDALTLCGCDPSLIGELDSHSTIELELRDMPSIYVAFESDEVLLWSRLAEYNEAVLNQRAGDILLALIRGCGYARSGQLQLVKANGFLELKVVVHPEHLMDGERFAVALNGYFDDLGQFSEILLR